MNLFKRIKSYFPLGHPYFNITSWWWYSENAERMIGRYCFHGEKLKRDGYLKQAINAAHFGYKYSIQLGFGKYAFFKTSRQAHIACAFF